MIRLIYNDGCRLGNRLFMYAAGRLLSRKLGLTLQSEPLEGFPRTRDVIGGRTLAGIVDAVDGADPIPEWPNVGRLIDRPLKIEHGWVNSRYFINDRALIRQWFGGKPLMKVDPEAVLVNVRLREFESLGLALHTSYYRYCLDRIMCRRIYLMTDDPGNPYLRFFDQYNPIIVEGHGIEHFFKALAFKRIVMSNSTFCWWFTFVSEATEVWFPMLNGGRCGSWCLNHLPTIDLRLNLPGFTHIYNVQNTLRDCPVITDAQREEAYSFSSPGKSDCSIMEE